MSVFFDRAGFVARLDELRNRYGLSKGEFADRVGMAQIFSRYKEPKPGAKERKIQAPSVDTLLSIASVFHTSVDWLLTGNDPCQEASGQQDLSFGRDWIRLPAHDQRPLDGEEREQLERTITVLRCPPGSEAEPKRALLTNIHTFYAVTTNHVAEVKARPKGGKVNNG